MQHDTTVISFEACYLASLLRFVLAEHSALLIDSREGAFECSRPGSGGQRVCDLMHSYHDRHPWRSSTGR